MIFDVMICIFSFIIYIAYKFDILVIDEKTHVSLNKFD